LQAQHPEFTGVVNARRVNEQHGPSGSNSIGFSTGSVVVPATGETIETCWRVMAFSRLDLPTLRRPKKAMCSRRL